MPDVLRGFLRRERFNRGPHGQAPCAAPVRRTGKCLAQCSVRDQDREEHGPPPRLQVPQQPQFLERELAEVMGFIEYDHRG